MGGGTHRASHTVAKDAGLSPRGRGNLIQEASHTPPFGGLGIRRPPKHRVRRQRMPREGMLIQMDGSHHPWLGDQVPPFTLLTAVDDATGTVVDALFCEQEDSRRYFLLCRA